MESNAWERAREAIARASERDESVVTPENAVSPFDASSTMVIPQPIAPHPTAPRPAPRPGPPPAPRSPGDGAPPYGAGMPPHGMHGNGHRPLPEPPTRPVDVSDPRGTARVAGPRPPTSPFPVADPHPTPTDPDTEPGMRTGAEAPRRSWWRRLLRR